MHFRFNSPSVGLWIMDVIRGLPAHPGGMVGGAVGVGGVVGSGVGSCTVRDKTKQNKTKNTQKKKCYQHICNKYRIGVNTARDEVIVLEPHCEMMQFAVGIVLHVSDTMTALWVGVSEPRSCYYDRVLFGKMSWSTWDVFLCVFPSVMQMLLVCTKNTWRTD